MREEAELVEEFEESINSGVKQMAEKVFEIREFTPP